jgi:hypothetical protein
MNWLVALVIVAALFLGAFGLCLSAATKSTVEIIDYATRVMCYDAGWSSGSNGLDQPLPVDESECQRVYSEGIADGKSGFYDPPARE